MNLLEICKVFNKFTRFKDKLASPGEFCEIAALVKCDFNVEVIIITHFSNGPAGFGLIDARNSLLSDNGKRFQASR